MARALPAGQFDMFGLGARQAPRPATPAAPPPPEAAPVPAAPAMPEPAARGRRDRRTSQATAEAPSVVSPPAQVVAVAEGEGDPMRFLPPRPQAWLDILNRRSKPTAPSLAVSALHTGNTVETLIDPAAGRWSLLSDGRIIEGALHGPPIRIVYLNQAAALALHAQAPLLPQGEGSHGTVGGSFRFARPGEPIGVKVGAIISAFSVGPA